tara:strand:+ start:440 stop:658 length:219 start_codon:yes stop_codon:yes gene_type:complete
MINLAVVQTLDFKEAYEKSIEEGYDDLTLVDTDVKMPKRKDYTNFNSWITEYTLCMVKKYKYTYGSKKKKKA